MKLRVQKKCNGWSLEEQLAYGTPWIRIFLYKERDSAYADCNRLRKSAKKGKHVSIEQQIISSKTFCLIERIT